MYFNGVLLINQMSFISCLCYSTAVKFMFSPLGSPFSSLSQVRLEIVEQPKSVCHNCVHVDSIINTVVIGVPLFTRTRPLFCK